MNFQLKNLWQNRLEKNISLMNVIMEVASGNSMQIKQYQEYLFSHVFISAQTMQQYGQK